MRHTEDEAKTKWCPLAPTYTLPSSRCIASECMAWRWAQKRNPDWKPEPGYMMSVTPTHPADDEPLYVADPEHGYCGLAGQP